MKSLSVYRVYGAAFLLFVLFSLIFSVTLLWSTTPSTKTRSSLLIDVNRPNEPDRFQYRLRKLKTLFDTNAGIRHQRSTETTSSDSSISLNDIYISVKTTRIFHKSRLDLILDTWYNLAKNQTYFFSDAAEDEYASRLGNHLVNTNCSVSHHRKALCCKMSVEFDFFIASQKKWWCHFDDDNYVNVPRLVTVLKQFDPLHDWYLGKPSIKQPLIITDLESKKSAKFLFATGGAGFCISRALALKMVPVASDGKLMSVGERIRLPDDVTIGYIIEHLLSKKLTLVDKFHSHLEPMAMLNSETLADQVSFSYSANHINRNVLSLYSSKVKRHDPTRFYSLHCHLFPSLC